MQAKKDSKGIVVGLSILLRCRNSVLECHGSIFESLSLGLEVVDVGEPRQEELKSVRVRLERNHSATHFSQSVVQLVQVLRISVDLNLERSQVFCVIGSSKSVGIEPVVDGGDSGSDAIVRHVDSLAPIAGRGHFRGGSVDIVLAFLEELTVILPGGLASVTVEQVVERGALAHSDNAEASQSK